LEAGSAIAALAARPAGARAADDSTSSSGTGRTAGARIPAGPTATAVATVCARQQAVHAGRTSATCATCAADPTGTIYPAGSGVAAGATIAADSTG